MTANDSPNDGWQKKVTTFSMPSQGKTGERFYTERFRFHVLPLLEEAFLSTKQEDGKFLVANVEIRIWKNDLIQKDQIESFLALARGLHTDLALLIQGKCRGEDGVVRELVDEKGEPVSMPAYYLDFDRKDGYEEKEMRREVPLHLLHMFFKAQMREPKVRSKNSRQYGRIDFFDQALRVSKGSEADGTADVESNCVGWATGKLPRQPVIKGDKAVVRNTRSMGYLVFVPGQSIEMLLALYPRMEQAYYREMVTVQHGLPLERGKPTERGLLRARNERAPELKQQVAGDSENKGKPARSPKPRRSPEEWIAHLESEVRKHEAKLAETKGTDKEALAAEKLEAAKAKLAKAKGEDKTEPKVEEATAESESAAPN